MRKQPLWAFVNRPETERSAIAAVKAVAAGAAEAGQQRLALEYIVSAIAGADEMTWVADEDGGERVSSFMSGRRYVGLCIRKIVNVPMEKLVGTGNGTAGRDAE